MSIKKSFKKFSSPIKSKKILTQTNITTNLKFKNTKNKSAREILHLFCIKISKNITKK